MNKKELKKKIKSMADFSTDARKYIDTIIGEYSENDELQRVKELRNNDNTKHETKIKNQAEELTILYKQKTELKDSIKVLNGVIAHQVDSFEYISEENRKYESLLVQKYTNGKITHLDVYRALYKEAMYVQVNLLGTDEDTASRKANMFAVQNTNTMYLTYNKYLELKGNDE